MNKTNLLITAGLTLLVVTLAVTVPPVIQFIGQVEDVLKFIGLVAVVAASVKVVELVKAKLKK
jgi:hypothetical protein